MDIFAEKKFTIWIIVILVILNIITLTFMWLTRNDGMRPMPPMPMHGENMGDHQNEGRMIDFLKSELDLNDEQLNQLIKERDDHFNKVKILLEEIHHNKKQIVEKVFEHTGQDTSVYKLSNDIGVAQAQIEILTYLHFIKVKEILGKDQKEKFKKFINQFFASTSEARKRESMLPPPQKK